MRRAKPSHEERLIDAAIVVIARYGYRQGSIARIVAQAGVSRATFYQHFEDKEACFLAAYRAVTERIQQDVRKVGSEERGGADPTGLRDVLARLLANADREPAAARVVLLEALAAGPAVRAEHEGFLGKLEGAIDSYLDERAAERGMRLEIPARSLLGGVVNVVASRVFRGETGRLGGLLDDLDAWLCAYLAPGRERRNRFTWAALNPNLGPPVAPEPSPLDRPPLRRSATNSAAVVASDQRQRLLAAIAVVVSRKGYEETTVADVVATAGVAREAFYEQFRSKEDVFLAAQAHAFQTSLSMAAEKFFGPQDWPNRVWHASIPMFEYIASVPDLARLDFVESYSVGAAAIRRSHEGRMAYTLLLEDGYQLRPEAERPPRLCSEAIAGAILEVLRHSTAEDRVAEIPDLVPQVVYVTLAPFVGVEEALELVEERCAAPAQPSA